MYSTWCTESKKNSAKFDMNEIYCTRDLKIVDITKTEMIMLYLEWTSQLRSIRIPQFQKIHKNKNTKTHIYLEIGNSRLWLYRMRNSVTSYLSKFQPGHHKILNIFLGIQLSTYWISRVQLHYKQFMRIFVHRSTILPKFCLALSVVMPIEISSNSTINQLLSADKRCLSFYVILASLSVIGLCDMRNSKWKHNDHVYKSDCFLL